jgi:adenosylhomocysteine nucleosidase
MPAEIAIIAAMEREVSPLVKHWARQPLPGAAARLPAFTSGNTLVVCSGIGMGPARRAAAAVFASMRPAVVISAGLAGALDPRMSVGNVFTPATVVDMQTGARYPAVRGRGVLLSASSVLGQEGKQRLAGSFSAEAVDMEAAAVALVAAQHDCPFLAVKAISEDQNFAMPSFQGFIDEQGRLHTARFLLSALLRPAVWPSVVCLQRNTSRAIVELCRTLAHLIEVQGAELNPALPGKS